MLLLQRPLSQQLELLHLWHAALSARLAAFLEQFKAAGGRVMLAAGGCYTAMYVTWEQQAMDAFLCACPAHCINVDGSGVDIQQNVGMRGANAGS